MHAAGPFPRRPRAAAPGPAPAQAAGQLEGPPGDPVRLNVIGRSQQALNRPRDPRITMRCHGTSMFPILGTGASPLSGSWRRRAAARRRNLRIRYTGTCGYLKCHDDRDEYPVGSAPGWVDHLRIAGVDGGDLVAGLADVTSRS